MAAAKQQNPAPPTSRGFVNRHRWVMLGLLLILAFNFVIRWRLAETPLERDEGEYAYAGQLLLQGIPPYKLAYNMKFPGTYFAYAALMTVFGETTRGIHLGLACVTSVTALLVFCIGNKLFQRSGGLLAAASYVLLSAAPAVFGLAGHATHFVALFVTAGTLALLWADEKPAAGRWWLAGLLFGTAILMKQHAIIIAGLGMFWIVWANWQRTPRIPTVLKSAAAYAVGCATSVLVVALGLILAGVGKQFIFWTLQYATQYASAASIRSAWPSFVNGFLPVLNSSWGLWLLGIIGLGVCLLPKQPIRQRVILILFLGGMLAACPGYHFRGHYFLPALPGLALLIAAAWTAARNWIKETPARNGIAGLFCAALLMAGWSNRQIWFEATPNQVARLMYTLNPFLEAPVVADYLSAHTAPDERIAVVGSEPQIYFHARRKAASGYIYMYALTEPLPLAQRMRDEFAQEIEAANPRYIVFVDIIASWVSLSQADNSILEWWNKFSQNYEAVGAVTLTEGQPSTYCWDEAVVRTLNLPDCHLIVYRRKNQ